MSTPTAPQSKSNLAFSLFLLRSPQRSHLLRWWRSLSPDFLLSTPCPWLPFDAIDLIASNLSPGWKVFEWGSGGSTLFWLKHHADVVSIEHNAWWYGMMQSHLTPSMALDYRLIPAEPQPEPGQAHDPSNPEDYSSSESEFAGMTFRAYASAIDPYPDGHFDLIVVDGRARPSCAMHALPKLKSNGLLVVDNVERARYAPALQSLRASPTATVLTGCTPGATWYTSTLIYRNV